MDGEDCWSLGIAESSPLASSFWMGLYLQQVEGQVDKCSHITGSGTGSHDASSMGPPHRPCCRTEHAQRCLREHATSLSPTVHEMVLGNITRLQQQQQQECAYQFLLPDCTLDWPAVNDFLEQDVVCIKDKDYATGGRKCAELAFLIHKEVKRRCELKKKERFDWTHSPELFVSLVDEVLSEEPVKTHTSLLMGTAALERALGDVYVSVTKSSHCPLLLRDLLATQQLESVLGPIAVFVLCCVIGPPTGLNLRNILWHGFVAHSELPIQYCAFLLVLTVSLGPLLSSHRPLTFRPYITFNQEHKLSTIFKGIEPKDFVVLEELLSSSFFILPTMLPSWKSSLDAFKVGRFDHCLVQLLPALEHGLRRVFACVNKCPQRVITAESSALYTTFDEILSPTLPSGEVNKLVSEIGPRKMDMLMDVLMYSEGPRVRDRISHGEVDLNCLSMPLANHILCLSLLFCAQYCLNKSILATPLISSWLTVEAEYVSLFHPLSLLKQEILELITSLSQWKTIPKPDSLLSHLSPHPSIEALSSNIHSARKHVKVAQSGPDCTDVCCDGVECVRCVVEDVWRDRTETLFMERRDMELVGVVRRTVENAQQAVSQISETARVRYSQHRDKQLRSRQRPNYQHLLSSMDLYLSSMLLLIVLSVASVSHILLEGHSQRLIKYQKKLLQVSENVSSQCSPSRNRWEEVDKLCQTLGDLALNFPVQR